MSAYPCCRHCDPGDDWHVTRARGAHRDLCPDGCNSAQDGEFRAVHLGRGGGGIFPRCGSTGWTQLTADGADVTCRKCRALTDGTWAAGQRWYDVRPCGEPAAYYRELRRGGPVHEECRRAANRDAADRRARRQRERLEEVLAA